MYVYKFYKEMINILMIDDDEQFCELTSRYLQIEGFQAHVCHDRQSGLKALNNQMFDVALLDVMLPNDSGYSILEELREHSTVPVIIYSALGDDINEIIGLETGADAYVKKDSQPRLLIAKIHSVLRRSQTEFQRKKQDKIVVSNELEMNCTKRQVRKEGELLNLTAAEYNILECLMLNAEC